jgi:hypothetical protein
MKHTTLFAILVCVTTLTHAADEGRIIRVDETTFSEVYPAVWFSPSTGEIVSLKERSEVPPEKKYEIWIEPDDPEFGYNPDTKPKGVGFALIGRGPDVFKNPKIPKDLKLKLKITHLMKEDQAREQLVFYCKSSTSTCVIMVTSMDVQKRVIQFKWRLLSKDSDAAGKDIKSDKK